MTDKPARNPLLWTILAAALFVLPACEDEPDSPGEKLDEALEESGDKIEEAGDKIEEKLDEVTD